MPQHRNYPNHDQQRRTLSPIAANRNSALCVGQDNLLAPFNSSAHNNPTNRNAPRQPDTAYQPESHQPYQSNPSYHGYEKGIKKGVYQVYDKDSDLHPEGFHTTLEQEGKEIQYFDEGFDKMDVNFVGIETLCRKYGTPFSSKSRLHKHLKDSCTSSVQPSLPDAPALTSLFPSSLQDLWSQLQDRVWPFEGGRIQPQLLLLSLKFSYSSQTPALQPASIQAVT